MLYTKSKSAKRCIQLVLRNVIGVSRYGSMAYFEISRVARLDSRKVRNGHLRRTDNVGDQRNQQLRFCAFKLLASEQTIDQGYAG